MRRCSLHRLTLGVALAAVFLGACTTQTTNEAANIAPSSQVIDGVAIYLENPLTVPTTQPTTVATTVATTLPPTFATTTGAPTLPPTLASTLLITQPPPPPPPTQPATTPPPPPPVTRRPAPTRRVAVTPTNPQTVSANTSVAKPPTTSRRPKATKPSKAKKKASTTQPAPATVPAPVPGPGFDGSTITLTNLGTKTNAAFGPVGRMVQGALESHFAAVNARGGIGGKYKVQVRFVETNYDPVAAASAYETVKDQSVGIASILGTPIVAGVTPLLDRDGMTASPASGDADWAARPALLPIGSTYQVQAINGSEYFWSVNGKNAAMCALSVAGSYGEAGVEGVAFAGSAAGGNVGAPVRVDPSTTNMLPAIQQLAAQGCRGVMLTTTPGQAITAVLTGERAGYRPRWIWMAPTWSDQVLTPQTSKILETSSWVMGEGPSLRRDPGPDTPGLVNLVREAKAAGNPWLIEQANIGVLFGYCQALLWERVLERAVANGDLSRSGIRRAAQEIGVVDFQGIVAPMDYSQPKRLSNGTSTVFRVDGSWLLGLFAVQTGVSPSAATYRGK